MLICRTPLRVSLFGGGSDFPSFFVKHTGAVLSFTLNKYIYTSIHPLIESQNILLKYSRNEFVKSYNDIEHPVFRAVISTYNISGIDIAVSSDIAAGTGLGSSSAFTVSTIHLIREYLNLSYTKESLAQEACDIELTKLKEPIGIQDQYASAFGGLNLMEFDKSMGVNVIPIDITNQQTSIFKETAILIRVGGIRSAGKILEAQSRFMNTSQKEEILMQMAEQAREAANRIHEGAEYLGTTLRQAWEYKKKLSPLVSNQEVDDLYEYLFGLGIYGGKLLGAGGSGYLLVFGSENVIHRIRHDERLSTLDIGFDTDGSKVIYRSEF